MGMVAVVIGRIVTMVMVGQMVSVLVMVVVGVVMVMMKMRVELRHFKSGCRLSYWERHQPTHCRMRGHIVGVRNVCEMVVR